MRAVVLTVFGIAACRPSLPDRDSAVLVAIEAPYDDSYGAGGDLWDDDPAWWVPGSGGTSVWTRQGPLTEPVPGDVGAGALRAFEDGTALVCGFDGLARWVAPAWTVIPFPDLPDLADASLPYVCAAFVAASIDEAWFVVDTGHLCRFDGGDITCADVSDTITSDPVYGPRVIEEMALTEGQVFIAHPTHRNGGTDVTDVYAVARAGAPDEVVQVERILGAASAMHAVPGDDRVVIEFGDLEGRSPVVFGAGGVEREIPIDGELGYVEDSRVAATYTTVPVADGSIYVVIDRSYVTLDCTGSEDDPDCTPVYQWAEIVVDRDVGGALTEVGHLGVEDAFVSGAGVRIDGALRVRATDGWYRLP